MGSYIPSTGAQREEMLRAVGVTGTRELFRDVPEQMLLHEPLKIPHGMSELDVSRAMSAMAEKNRVYATVLRGAGSYDHYIPSIVKYIPAKEEFLTAYTPYQAEMSQGLLHRGGLSYGQLCSLYRDAAGGNAQGCRRKQYARAVPGCAGADAPHRAAAYPRRDE